MTIGTFLFLITDVELTIQNSDFLNGYGQIGGAIYLSGFSNLKVFKSSFKNNQAFTNGGAIYAVGFQSIILEQCDFLQNRAQDGGDDIYASNTDKNLTLQSVSIVNKLARNSIYAEQCGVQIIDSQIKEINNIQSTQGAGLQCFNCRNIYISQSLFSSLFSQIGSAIYIEENEGNKLVSDSLEKYKIQNSKFQNCVANVAGGVFFLNNIQYMSIQNSTFQDNKALYQSTYSKQEIAGAGGAIYFTCDETYLNCQLTLSRQNKFTNNLAEIKGGAIFWDAVEPQFSDIIFSKNKALYYGDNIACFSQNLIVINQTYYNFKLLDLGILKNDDQIFAEIQLKMKKCQ
ncbi:UNKNOWN [Stylonychia lemnae]|uniref:Pectin lyase fold/virulence factor n=1 Tax=Stylonychia lemnae TaxID=5949 RepID=A0A078A7U5_STYLE|nr:UNKNOWN [Stylonychia lemnae]|eukprot:CDW77911.1 UNKNOWN [Stylonychia lemnae]